MARMYGFERADEVVGRDLSEFLSRDMPANVEYLKAFIRSGYRLTDANSEEYDKNGNLRYFLNNLIGIVGNGLLQRAWGTQRDVTDSKRADELQKFLVSASAVLGTSLDYETTLRNVARLAVPFFADCCIVDIALNGSVQRVAIAHRDPSKEELAQQMRYRYPYNPEANIGVPKVLRTGEAEMFSHISLSLLESAAPDADHLRFLREVGLRSYMCVPMIGRGQTVGAISFITAESGYHYTQTDLALAQDIGRRAGIAIENAHLYQEAQQAREEAEAARAQAEAAQIEAERANRAKDEFLAVVSHELRTPLTPILGWLHLLRTSRLNAPQTTQALETIERSARLQVQLVNDLLDVSRIVSGKLRLEIRQCDINRAITDAVASVRGAADMKGIHLKVTVDVVGQVDCDGDRLQQIVWNLLSNAIKFSPEGSSVELRVQRQEPKLIISVRDYGIGIEPDFLPYVFDRFRQADSATTRRHGGLGLGLAIVNHLVEMHGGTIVVQSDGAGQGALFSVALPLRTPGPQIEPLPSPETSTASSEYSLDRAGDARQTDIAQLSANSVEHPGQTGSGARAELPAPCGADSATTDEMRLSGLRVLVVDDEPDARTMIAAVLAQSGAAVLEAASAAHALSVLKNEVPDVIISDIAMPDIDGYTFIDRVRHANPTSRDIPAMALTARARAVDRQHSLDAGFQHHLCKPVDADDLIKAVASLAAR
jgi:signal transduction histidine kinase/ActR/RegA family two-component response regulator